MPPESMPTRQPEVQPPAEAREDHPPPGRLGTGGRHHLHAAAVGRGLRRRRRAVRVHDHERPARVLGGPRGLVLADLAQRQRNRHRGFRRGDRGRVAATPTRSCYGQPGASRVAPMRAPKRRSSHDTGTAVPLQPSTPPDRSDQGSKSEHPEPEPNSRDAGLESARRCGKAATKESYPRRAVTGTATGRTDRETTGAARTPKSRTEPIHQHARQP